MPHNEGFLGKHNFKGESVCTQDHKPIILNGLLKENHAPVLLGSVLVLDTDGINVIGANNTMPIIGVSDEDIETTSEQKYISYIAHGTVKAEKLKGTDGGAFTDYQKLQATGVYAL